MSRKIRTDRAFIIAEAGVNHNGNEDLAMKLIEIGVEAGVDAVKFQTFKASKLVTNRAPKAEYQQKNDSRDESQFKMLQRLELSNEAHRRLYNYSQSLGMKFMSTAFDEGSLQFLVEEIGVDVLKVPSGEITNGPLLLKIGSYQLPTILSTGMASLEEIENALKVLSYGYNNPGKKPESFAEVTSFFSSPNKLYELNGLVTILHCTSEYPAPLKEVNLRAMNSLGLQFGLPIGYSDHTEGIFVPVLAVAAGAKVIEKHFTSSRSLPGPDHLASIEPDELKEMVRQIRHTEVILGSSEKAVQTSEQGNRNIARRSLIAAKNIQQGEILCEDNIVPMRPEGGTSPIRIWDLLGRPAERSYQEGEFIL